jgi:hypothetical protein
VAITTTSIAALKRLANYPLDAMLQEVGPLALIQHAAAQSQAELHKQLSRTIQTEGRPQVARVALAYSTMVNSTRRLASRPAVVLFSPTGFSCP